MIISRIMGGLGNQMFQYAFGRTLSLKYNMNLLLETSFYSNQQGNGVIRSFELNKFNDLNLNTNITFIEGTLYQLEENTPPNVKLIKNNTYLLNGYWQNELYFNEYEDIIKNDFAPTEKTFNKLITILDSDNVVSLHVRRTDFLKTNGHNQVQELSYYEKAIEEIGIYDKIFVFSDDLQWCKDNLKFNNMFFIEGLSNIEDLWLMSLCKNNIIANSSFSWWGAWLNKNETKKVIAPSKWFKEEINYLSNDIICKKWIKI